MTKPSKYSDAEVEAIRAWLIEGKSATEIAALRGRKETRNVIIGIINLRKLRTVGPDGLRIAPTRIHHARPKAKAPARPKAAPPARNGYAIAERPSAPAPLPPAPARAWEAGTGPTLVELEPGQCRFPIGEAEGAAQMFCGCAIADTRYCVRHATPGEPGGAYRVGASATQKERDRALERLARDIDRRGKRAARGD